MNTPYGLNGSTPQVNRSGESRGPKRLFHSERAIALIKDKTVEGGYGALTSGTVMAVNSVTSNLVPYVPVALGSAASLAMADVANGGNTIRIPIADIGRYKVGSVLILAYGTTYHDAGAITAVTKVNDYLAQITFTTVAPTAAFTVAAGTVCYIKTDSSGAFSKAAYILDQDIFTGTGEDALGAVTSVVISNAILYTSSLVNMDAAAITDFGAVVDGQHTILK